jgi:hypothetical protein
MRGLSPIPAIPLFPLATHIADKIVGVMFRDELGRSANRYRDLVDLALYAGAVDINTADLHTALHARAAARAQPTPSRIEIPDSWQDNYQRVAARTTLPTELHHAHTSAEAVATWLNPVLSGDIDNNTTWDHHAGAWHDTSQPATRPGKVWVRPHMRSGRPVSDYFRRPLCRS